MDFALPGGDCELVGRRGHCHRIDRPVTQLEHIHTPVALEHSDFLCHDSGRQESIVVSALDTRYRNAADMTIDLFLS